MTVAVVASLLIGLAAAGLGVEDLRKINNINHTISGLNESIAGLNRTIAGLNASSAAPAAIVIKPTSGTTVSGVVLLDAAPLTASVSSVSFVASGGTSQNAPIATAKLSLGGWFSEWSTTSLPNGTYQIAAVAGDSAGKSSTSPAVTVTIKNP